MADRKRIVVAMSGGVDSSTAAALLKRQGHEVIGVGLRFPQLAPATASRPTCCGIGGMDDAARAASLVGIPFYVLDYEDVFRESVIDYFFKAYLDGATPNPCVECNRLLKFGRLLEFAGDIGAGCVATGHYARVLWDGDSQRWQLLKGLDKEKDQSYFLYPLTQEQLSRVMFPLGELTKTEVRKMARSFGLNVADKPGSQDVCFLGDTDYREALAGKYPDAVRPGRIVDCAGRTVGEHRGTAFYTIGQRKHLGVAAGVPLYVLDIDPAEGTLVVGSREQMLVPRLSVANTNWISLSAAPASMPLGVRVRYRQREEPALVTDRGGGRAEVEFVRPHEGAARGQSAVFYDGDVVIGGGVIS